METVGTKLLAMCPECMRFYIFSRDEEINLAMSSHTVCGCGRMFPVPDEIDDITNVTDKEVYDYIERMNQGEDEL